MDESKGWFAEFADSMEKLAGTAGDNLGVVLGFLATAVVFVLIAYAAELFICKKRGVKRLDEKLRVKRMAIIAMMSVISIILMLFKVPLWFLPGFYTIDISELPVVVGAFTLGPVAGVAIETVKILLNILVNGTTTAFVGEYANFLVGCALVVPSSICYYIRKSRKSAVIGLGIGALVNGIVGAILNAKLLLPTYAKLFMKSDSLDGIIGMGTDVNSLITDLTSFITFAVVPFNLIKCAAVSIITILIYKKISYLLKGNSTTGQKQVKSVSETGK